ncbi:putative tubulin polyglutamylase TTLL2 [Intoshia linei]|uniref:Putative tubulin polyglutamylase TTLL2 n=1 Tax=Intoshia linei TaxID=1819745 RepID=A0A177B6P7_9BILA|nr:putative tubulin polyglutamylase TTLL2 [Intoshia linei]
MIFNLNAPITYTCDNRAPSLVRKVIQEEDWINYDEKIHYDCNFRWRTNTFDNRDYMQLWPDQFLNHHLQTNSITQKDILSRLVHSCHSINKGIFNHYPKTYILPIDYSRFMIDARNPIINNTSNYWIYKPAFSSRGRGISISNNLDQFIDVPIKVKYKHKFNDPNRHVNDLNYRYRFSEQKLVHEHSTEKFHKLKQTNFIVQQYIKNPFLVNGYKLDLRLYVIVMSFTPLQIYINKTGLARFATTKYNLNDLDNKYSHLTNTSINKKAFNCGKFTRCKWTLQQIRNYFKQLNIDDSECFSRIIAIIIETICLQATTMPKQHSVELETAATTNCFELYGFDIIIDKNMKPWLLEVNFSPSLVDECTVDKEVKIPLLKSIFRLIKYKCLEKRKQMHQKMYGYKRFEPRPYPKLKSINNTKIKKNENMDRMFNLTDTLNITDFKYPNLAHKKKVKGKIKYKKHSNIATFNTKIYPSKCVGTLYLVFPFNNITKINAKNINMKIIINECNRLVKFRNKICCKIKKFTDTNPNVYDKHQQHIFNTLMTSIENRLWLQR